MAVSKIHFENISSQRLPSYFVLKPGSEHFGKWLMFRTRLRSICTKKEFVNAFRVPSIYSYFPTQGSGKAESNVSTSFFLKLILYLFVEL